MARNILGIVGSYRKGGIVDQLVSEVLLSAQQHGATTAKIYLVDQHIEFCTNCRACCQEPGPEPGRCVHADDMAALLARCRQADGLVLGSPVNCFNVTAITRRFMERLICMAFWPWGGHAPAMRDKSRPRRAVLVTATAMPALFGRLFTGAVRALSVTASSLGARPVATIFAGMIAQKQDARPSPTALRQAQRAGRLLAAG